MKKFKVTMVGTSIKEIFVSAKDKNDALNRVDKCYLDDEQINFCDDDIIDVKRDCKEIISRRREKFNVCGYDLPINYGNEFIKDVMNTFVKAEKEVKKEGYLQVKLTKEDINRLEDLYKKYKADTIVY